MKRVIAVFLTVILISGCDRLTDIVSPVAPQSLNASSLAPKSPKVPAPKPSNTPAPTPSPKGTAPVLPDGAASSSWISWYGIPTINVNNLVLYWALNAVVYAVILAGIVFSYALYRDSTINQTTPAQPNPPPQQPNSAPLNPAPPQNPPVQLNPPPNPNPFVAQQPAPPPQDNPFANPQPNLFAPAQPAQAPRQNPFAQPAPPINLNPEPPPDLWNPNMPAGVPQGGIGAPPSPPPPAQSANQIQPIPFPLSAPNFPNYSQIPSFPFVTFRQFSSHPPLGNVLSYYWQVAQNNTMSEYGKLCEYLELIAILKQSGRYAKGNEVKLLEDEYNQRWSYVMSNYPFNVLEIYPESSLANRHINVNELRQICFAKAAQLYANFQERRYYYREYLNFAVNHIRSRQAVFDGDFYATLSGVTTEIRQCLPKVLW